MAGQPGSSSPASGTFPRTTTVSGPRWPAGSPPSRCPRASGSSTTASAALHLAYDLLEPWDALVLVDALPAGATPGPVARARDRRGRTSPAGGASTPTAWTRPRCWPASAALGGRLPPRTLRRGLPGRRDRRRDGARAARSHAAVDDAGGTVRTVRDPDRRRRRWSRMCLGIPGRVVERVPGLRRPARPRRGRGRRAAGQHRHARTRCSNPGSGC